jgi:hypothetical protein
VRLECSSCGRSVTERVERALLGRMCLSCQKGKLVEPETIANREEGGDPSIRLNSPSDASPWPHQQGRRNRFTGATSINPFLPAASCSRCQGSGATGRRCHCGGWFVNVR